MTFTSTIEGQLTLGFPAEADPKSLGETFPRTRYQGSKRRLARVIVEHALRRNPKAASVLDAFGGTGAVAYAFKQAGRAVTYNDCLNFNQQVGLALIENDSVRFDDNDLHLVTTRRLEVDYPDFIARTFEGIYFKTEENRWLDMAATHIAALECRFKRALAWYALFQAALAKRPYNLFHRSNLYMRLADVPRNFGNKASWDRSFDEHFRKFAGEANRAVFRSPRPCRSLQGDVFDLEAGYDLVYIDPPYVARNGTGVDYRDFYHFLEGIVDYENWPNRIEASSRHRRLMRIDNGWCRAESNAELFAKLFEHFAHSALAVSYRSNGIPTIDQLVTMLERSGREVEVACFEPRPYVLSITRQTQEMLILTSPRISKA